MVNKPSQWIWRGAARFLHSQKVFAARDIPYQTQLVPFAAIFTVLGDSADSDVGLLEIYLK